MSNTCKTWSLGIHEPLSKTIGIMPKNKSMTYILTHHPEAGLYLANRSRISERTQEELAHCRWVLKNQAFMHKNFPRGTCALVEVDEDKYHAWILSFENGNVRVRWCDQNFEHRVSDSDDDYMKEIYCKDECVSFSKVFFLTRKRKNIDPKEEEIDQTSTNSDDVEEMNRDFRRRKTLSCNDDDMADFIVDDDEENSDDEYGDEEYSDDENGDDDVEIVSNVNTENEIENDNMEKLWKLYQKGRITKQMYENYMKRVLDKMVSGQ